VQGDEGQVDPALPNPVFDIFVFPDLHHLHPSPAKRRRRRLAGLERDGALRGWPSH
jgi:hypothetical protein